MSIGPDYVLKPLSEILAPLAELWSRLQWLRGGPVPGSPASKDGVTALGQQSWLFASLGASVAVDHLESWRRLAEAKLQPMWGHLTLIRGSLESSVLVRYLADPKADQDERIRRGVGVQRADLEERKTYEGRRVDMIAAGGQPARVRLADLEKAAKHAGIKPRQRLGATELCARYIDTVKDRDGEYIYRLLSAFAHGQQWQVLAGSEFEIEGPAAGLANVDIAKVSADPRVAAEMSSVAIETLTSAMSDLERYAGKPAETP